MKPKFLEGGGERGHDTDGARENLEGLGGLCQLRLQQVALDVLRLGGLSNGLPQGQPPGRIHGGRAVQQHVGHQKGDLLHGGMPRMGTARCWARTSTSPNSSLRSMPRARSALAWAP